MKMLDLAGPLRFGAREIADVDYELIFSRSESFLIQNNLNREYSLNPSVCLTFDIRICTMSLTSGHMKS